MLVIFGAQFGSCAPNHMCCVFLCGALCVHGTRSLSKSPKCFYLWFTPVTPCSVLSRTSPPRCVPNVCTGCGRCRALAGCLCAAAAACTPLPLPCPCRLPSCLHRSTQQSGGASCAAASLIGFACLDVSGVLTAMVVCSVPCSGLWTCTPSATPATPTRAPTTTPLSAHTACRTAPSRSTTVRRLPFPLFFGPSFAVVCREGSAV